MGGMLSLYALWSLWGPTELSVINEELSLCDHVNSVHGYEGSVRLTSLNDFQAPVTK